MSGLSRVDNSATNADGSPNIPPSSAKPATAWTTLEVAKLLVAVLVPISVGIVGYTINQTLQIEAAAAAARSDAQKNQWQVENSKNDFSRSQDAFRASEVIKERLRLWNQIAIPLNDILAYCMYVGRWKEFTAKDIVARKRAVDSIVYGNRPFFSDKFFSAYESFMGKTFDTNREMGKDAAIRTNAEYRRDSNLTDSFSPGDRNAIFKSYNGLLSELAAELKLDITLSQTAPPSEAGSKNERK